MLHLEELVGTITNKEDLLNAIKNDGYDFCDEFETWLDDIGFFRVRKNGINIADLVVIDKGLDTYLVDSIDLLFSIKAKVLSDIVDAKYFYKNGKWFYKEDKSQIGDIQDVYNHIGDSGCIAYDEDMLILIFDEAENDPYSDIDDDTIFTDIDLVIIYEQYCNFC